MARMTKKSPSRFLSLEKTTGVAGSPVEMALVLTLNDFVFFYYHKRQTGYLSEALHSWIWWI